MAEKQSDRVEDRKQSRAAYKRRQIKEVKTKLGNLSPAAAALAVEGVVADQARKQLGGFTNFIREQGVIAVGIGIVLGIQIKEVVDTIMASLVDPITKLLPGGTTLTGRTFHIKSADIGWGAIAYSLFTFVIVAFIIYAAYKLLRLDKLKKQDK